jgi:hypothetical protein
MVFRLNMLRRDVEELKEKTWELDSTTRNNLGTHFFSYYISTLLHLPPLRFHCADGCWDRTQDRCSWCIGSQTL